MPRATFTGGTVILERHLLPGGKVAVEGERIAAVSGGPPAGTDGELIDLQGGYLCPGFVDLHVHGGDGADFMDGTLEAFQAVSRSHARHGSTSLLPTSRLLLPTLNLLPRRTRLYSRRAR